MLLGVYQIALVFVEFLHCTVESLPDLVFVKPVGAQLAASMQNYIPCCVIAYSAHQLYYSGSVSPDSLYLGRCFIVSISHSAAGIRMADRRKAVVAPLVSCAAVVLAQALALWPVLAELAAVSRYRR